MAGILAVLVPGPQAQGHEAWIEPAAFEVSPGTPISAKVLNGQELVGSEIPFLTDKFNRLVVLIGDRDYPIPGRLGDRPAIRFTSNREGLHVIALDAGAWTVTYEDWQQFADFGEHKDLPDFEKRHQERSLPADRVTESFVRFAKSLVAVGHGEGRDRETGLLTEFVALKNPYTDDLAGGLPVRLLYQGEPRPDAQIEVFARDSVGAVSITYLRTDGRGGATIPVVPGHDYLLDAVILREPSERYSADLDVMWESLWASLTFAVPAG